MFGLGTQTYRTVDFANKIAARRTVVMSYAFGNDIALKQYQAFSAPYVGLYAILGDSTARYNVQQRFMLYRFHVKDEIYFDQSFTMKMDDLGWTGPRYDDYTSVAYYYLTTPSRLPFELPENKDLIMK